MGFARVEAFLDDSTSFLSGEKGRLKEEGHNQAAATDTGEVCTRLRLWDD